MRSLNPLPTFPPNLDAPVTRSLSLQFIIDALVDAYALIERPLTIQRQCFAQDLSIISDELEKILLFSLENPFKARGSVLDKLCFYSEILLQASSINDDEILHVLEDMRKSILIMRSKIIVWKKMQDPSPLEEVCKELIDLYSSLYQNLCRFFSALTGFLKEARSDENVLMQLIENKDTLNAHLGTRYIETLLQSFFPAGHAQLRAAIHEGYTRRGFNQFLAKVEPLIDAIEWETPCCITTSS